MLNQQYPILTRKYAEKVALERKMNPDWVDPGAEGFESFVMQEIKDYARRLRTERDLLSKQKKDNPEQETPAQKKGRYYLLGTNPAVKGADGGSAKKSGGIKQVEVQIRKVPYFEDPRIGETPEKGKARRAKLGAEIAARKDRVNDLGNHVVEWREEFLKEFCEFQPSKYLELQKAKTQNVSTETQNASTESQSTPTETIKAQSDASNSSTEAANCPTDLDKPPAQAESLRAQVSKLQTGPSESRAETSAVPATKAPVETPQLPVELDATESVTHKALLDNVRDPAEYSKGPVESVSEAMRNTSRGSTLVGKQKRAHSEDEAAVAERLSMVERLSVLAAQFSEEHDGEEFRIDGKPLSETLAEARESIKAYVKQQSTLQVLNEPSSTRAPNRNGAKSARPLLAERKNQSAQPGGKAAKKASATH